MIRARGFFAAFGLALAVLVPGPLFAQDSYPSKAIRMVVPFAPGGVTDLAARAISERLSPLLGQTVLVENRGGAGGAIGAMAVVKAPADGYTLLFSANGTTLVLPALDPSVQYDAVRDFTAVAMAVRIPLVLAAAPTLGISDVKGLRELLRANPGKYAYGSAGAGTTGHIWDAAFARAIGVPQLLHVPYKGTAPAIVDLVAGRVAYLFDSPAPLAEHFRAGRALALAVTSKERMPQFPNIPTIAEAGLAEIQTPETWSGIYAPKGTPQAIVQRLNRDTNRVLKEPDLVKRLLDLGMVPASASLAEVQALVNREAPLWGPMLKSLNFIKGN